MLYNSADASGVSVPLDATWVLNAADLDGDYSVVSPFALAMARICPLHRALYVVYAPSADIRGPALPYVRNRCKAASRSSRWFCSSDVAGPCVFPQLCHSANACDQRAVYVETR